ncbi:MAG: DUF2085 domain-containing protein [Candidatus Aminicenantes bacterium]|nr:DUF2085 domain-containing protein [Candidatus Aminicenantes bacterium]
MPARPSSGLRPSRAAAVFYILSLLGAGCLVASTFLAPWLAARESILAEPLYRMFSHVCHQIPSRCLHISGHPMAVCGRCLGVYLGIFLGCLIYPFWRGWGNIRLPARWVFPAFSFPLAFDVLGNALRLWDSSVGLRLASGFFWGAVLPFYFLAAAAELAYRGLAIRRSSN